MIKVYVFFSIPKEKFVIKYLTGAFDKEVGYLTKYNELLVQIIYLTPHITLDSQFKIKKSKLYKFKRYFKRKIIYFQKLNSLIKEFIERSKQLWIF